jgi:hypothetical protein
MHATVSAVTGTTDPRLTKLNEKHRNFYGRQKKKIEKLCSHGEIMVSAVRRVNWTAALLKAPTTPEASIERLRNAPSFEQEVLELDTVLKTSRVARSQSDRAKGWRVKVSPNRIPLREVILCLISGAEYRGLWPRELWPHFQAKLCELECGPILLHGASSTAEQSIRFHFFKLGSDTPSYRQLSFVQFRRIVLDLRREKR